MKFTKTLKSNIVTVIILILFIVPQTRKPIQVGVNKVLAQFSPGIKNSEDLETLKDFNWSLVDAEGNQFELSEAKGKVIIINLWATWCPPCIAEMPSLEELYKDYGDKVEFVLVSDESQKKTSAFLEERKLTLPSYKPISKIPNKLYTRSIPATYILDKKGRIRVQKTGAANWNSKRIRKLIDKLLLK